MHEFGQEIEGKFFAKPANNSVLSLGSSRNPTKVSDRFTRARAPTARAGRRTPGPAALPPEGVTDVAVSARG
jgi:hypothetical protein